MLISKIWAKGLQGRKSQIFTWFFYFFLVSKQQNTVHEKSEAYSRLCWAWIQISALHTWVFSSWFWISCCNAPIFACSEINCEIKHNPSSLEVFHVNWIASLRKIRFISIIIRKSVQCMSWSNLTYSNMNRKKNLDFIFLWILYKVLLRHDWMPFLFFTLYLLITFSLSWIWVQFFFFFSFKYRFSAVESLHFV